MTAATELALADYADKRVELLTVGAEEAVIGTVASASPQAIAFKEKGRSSLTLVPAEQIADIRIAPEAEVDMKARRLNLVNLDSVKRHLVDRHGYALADINAMAPEQALGFHDSIDHTPLSHFHADPPANKDEAKAKEESAQG
ncbi:hypothetical protein SEA_GOURDTHYMES_78 [Gordonia phage GourdThymes]|uniref:Uncharacterized protein n=11 Tax=Montyvirus TaxID=2733196 RepID=A0A2L1IVK1_9CAUD|nr:hypothetical protein BH763_gp052 [Gordonia phage Monty]YP_009795661.1 hypothetical protein HOS45_gp053 [Gordonia phage BirksAndSocks]YP_009837047.1 hypothetical protein HWB50_gp053 [Gordonia phage Adgers]YP_009843072.1 hypothetical protein HWC02_gp054 [Gordonia phage Sombrero]YP_009848361.1 hypothetical protein HWC39_gp053 [Gordonia phage Beaver]YP_009853322.1 hypothetical protein HWC76_gp054 [Gordonia phage Jellybones]AVD99586.1 hypothetical protein SEA_BONEHAM_81 [Gordonia phage Boneham]